LGTLPVVRLGGAMIQNISSSACYSHVLFCFSLEKKKGEKKEKKEGKKKEK